MEMRDPPGSAASWETEYKAGRYRGEPPVRFVRDILSAARVGGLGAAEGIYIGCGNGRNYLPLVAGGLDLIGLDVSREALEQLGELAPERRRTLVHGTIDLLPQAATYPLVVGIQVFQHGDRTGAHAHIAAAQERLAPGGLFCIRVNAVGTDVYPEHEVTERHVDGGFTVRYLAGSKQGLQIHFFSTEELTSPFGEGYESMLPLRLDQTRPNRLGWVSGLSGRRSGVELERRARKEARGGPPARRKPGAEVCSESAPGAQAGARALVGG
jgi:SAM-dependent methyltransferase